MAQRAEDDARFTDEVHESIVEAAEEREAREDRMHDDLVTGLNDVKQEQAQLRADQQAQGRTNFWLTLSVLVVAVLTLVATVITVFTD